MTTPFGAYQYEVYFQGLTGVLPKLRDERRRRLDRHTAQRTA